MITNRSGQLMEKIFETTDDESREKILPKYTKRKITF